MSIPINHECFKWVWKTSKSANKTFVFSIEGGVFGYTMEGGGFSEWGPTIDELEKGMEGWYKVRNIELHGPTLSPICAKIRQMEARRKHVY